MNPIEFITIASQIASSQSDAAGCRTAISRAYYGAYHAARELVEQEMGIPCKSGGNEHLLLQRYLSNCKVTEGQDLSSLLKNLHTSRKQADYDLKSSVPEKQQQARFCVSRAEKILAQIQLCSAPTVKVNIQTGIQLYKQVTNQ